MKRVIWIVLIVLALLVIGALLLLRVPAVQDRLLHAAIERQIAGARSELLPFDGLRVVTCGTGSPLPSRNRAQACTLVALGDALWLVDVGMRSVNNLVAWGVPLDRVAGVLFTHFHSDHLGDLGELNLQSWVLGREGPLEVHGPTGVEPVVRGFAQAYAQDARYRSEHHGATFLRPADGRLRARAFRLRRPPAPERLGPRRQTVLERDGLRITAFEVEHDPVRPAVGYRFDFGGRSLVVSGDTKRSDGLAVIARDADVLLHEAQANHVVEVARRVAEREGLARPAKILGDIPSYHTSPVEAAELANEAGVRLLVLTHLTPPPDNRLLERVFLRGVDAVRADGVILAHDGLQLDLPAGSDELRIGTID